MGELVDHLGERTGQQKIQPALQVEKEGKGARQFVPFARHQVDVGAKNDQHDKRKDARVKQFGDRQCSFQEGVGPYQRDAEKQVVVEQLLVPGALGRHPASTQLTQRFRIAGDNQLVVDEERNESAHLLFGRGDRRLVDHRIDQFLNRGMIGPACKQLEFEQADFVKAVAHRIENAPTGRPITVMGPGMQLQVLTKLGQLDRLGFFFWFCRNHQHLRDHSPDRGSRTNRDGLSTLLILHFFPGNYQKITGGIGQNKHKYTRPNLFRAWQKKYHQNPFVRARPGIVGRTSKAYFAARCVAARPSSARP